jgi:hypothetical protein
MMNKTHSMLMLSIALTCTIIGCSDEAKYKAMAEKYDTVQAGKTKPKAISAEEMPAHSDEALHHAVPAETAGAHKLDTDEIGRNADDLPAAA